MPALKESDHQIPKVQSWLETSAEKKKKSLRREVEGISPMRSSGQASLSKSRGPPSGKKKKKIDENGAERKKSLEERKQKTQPPTNKKGGKRSRKVLGRP